MPLGSREDFGNSRYAGIIVPFENIPIELCVQVSLIEILNDIVHCFDKTWYTCRMHKLLGLTL